MNNFPSSTKKETMSRNIKNWYWRDRQRCSYINDSNSLFSRERKHFLPDNIHTYGYIVFKFGKWPFVVCHLPYDEEPDLILEFFNKSPKLKRNTLFENGTID